MARLIDSQGRPVANKTRDYRHLDGEQPLVDGPVTVPLARWLEQREALRFHNGPVGVRLNGFDDPAELREDLRRLPLVALGFEKFTDGRAYSQARLLRERYGYGGELRATGDVLRDQLYFMRRCGFDSFELAEGQDPAQAAQAFDEIGVQYQTAADDLTPVRERRQAAV